MKIERFLIAECYGNFLNPEKYHLAQISKGLSDSSSDQKPFRKGVRLTNLGNINFYGMNMSQKMHTFGASWTVKQNFKRKIEAKCKKKRN